MLLMTLFSLFPTFLHVFLIVLCLLAPFTPPAAYNFQVRSNKLALNKVSFHVPISDYDITCDVTKPFF